MKGNFILRDTKSTILSNNQKKNKLKIFTDLDDSTAFKVDKLRPEIELLSKKIIFDPNTICLILNSGNGALGLILAVENKNTQFFLYDNNIQNAKLSQKNLTVNFKYTKNAHVVDEKDIQKSFDVIIFSIVNDYSGLSVIEENIFFSKTHLTKGGKFYLITHKRLGAKRHIDFVEKIFGVENSLILAKGKGGYIIIEAINTSLEKSNFPEKGNTIYFSVLGRRFSLFTEAGLFSKDNIDEGTKFLLETVDLSSFENLLDLGCGWGVIGIVALVINPKGNATLVDVDRRAINITRKNIKKMGLTNRASAILTDDVRSLNCEFDLILCNPPYHIGSESLVKLFSIVKKVIRTNGEMYLVIEKTYLKKFTKVLTEVFSHYCIFRQNGNYFIIKI
jgi:16S rRNA (guanine1207-N2)-methyltransferase